MSNTEKIPCPDLLETVNLAIFLILRLDGQEIIRSETFFRNKLVRKILLPGVDSVGVRSGPAGRPTDSGGRPTDFYESDRNSGVRPNTDRASDVVRRTSDTILGLILTILGLKAFF